MSFSDPQSVTINAVAKSLPRIGSGTKTGVFRDVTGEWKLELSHEEGKNRNRHLIKLTQSKITTDPYASDRNIAVGASVYCVADIPTVGFSATEASYLLAGLVDFLDVAGTGAKFLGGEQ